MNDFNGWLSEVTGGKNPHSIASDLGVSDSTLRRWLLNRVPAEVVVSIARFYGGSSLDGLLAARYLTSDDIVTGSVHEALRHATDRQLTEEILRRQVVAEMKASEAEILP